ncbi:XRE family transcriptional regulator [Candidatus Chloroploca sp. M-50]|uniref:XRE family transcriptional regulator n=1 Tax=Candidatus Chloroploca mongolica TaxID=2528176 RepID=A0ABS4DA28_9CHLR|nr:XRE family transcriptional regulator [Candidatus Chloroploca mongolica]MBP1466278.1 XRE family transcriptional regulator [Candidatus Chloroploca mongolica]
MTANILDDLDLRALGRELQLARKRSGLTQEQAASVIGVARTTLTAIEKGERRIRPNELISLARAYNRQVSDFVRTRPSIEPFEVQFRGPAVLADIDQARIDPLIADLQELSRNYFELEEIVGSPLSRRYPDEFSIAGLHIDTAAEELATRERARLNLGDAPLPVLRDILEQEVGLRIFYLKFPQRFSAMYFYDHTLGGCIAVNSDHQEDRRRWSLAHDYGHFLVSRYKPVLYVENAYQRKPESERFVDHFAMYFLMPTSSLSRRFNDIRRVKSKITPADLCILAHYFGVSFEALMGRLEGMKLVATGTLDKLRAGGFKIREAQKELGLSPIPARDSVLPLRYQYLALEALDRELITEGHFAHLMHLERLEARRLADLLRDDVGVYGEDNQPVSLDLSQPL